MQNSPKMDQAGRSALGLVQWPRRAHCGATSARLYRLAWHVATPVHSDRWMANHPPGYGSDHRPTTPTNLKVVFQWLTQ
jgi:hypothetical protein